MRKFRWRKHFHRYRPRFRRWKRRAEIELPLDARVSNFEKLVRMTPQAARAQNAMDKHHGGYKNREARLMELIAFNDLFVNTVLELPENELPFFTEKLFGAMQAYCQKHREPMFQREQYEAIAHGLSREIAVFKAAQANNFDVHMTSRQADSMGVDMQIRDPQTNMYVNIDCKTPSAYRYRVHDLMREGRLSEQGGAAAMVRGFTQSTNGRGAQAVTVVLLRISDEEFGQIRHYRFVDTKLISERLRTIIQMHGLDDDNFYRYEDNGN